MLVLQVKVSNYKSKSNNCKLNNYTRQLLWFFTVMYAKMSMAGYSEVNCFSV